LNSEYYIEERTGEREREEKRERERVEKRGERREERGERREDNHTRVLFSHLTFFASLQLVSPFVFISIVFLVDTSTSL
jgi:hypothetical protein